MTRFVLTVALGLTLAIALLLAVAACAESESVVPPNVTVSPTAVPPTPTIHAHTVAGRGAATASVAARIYYSDVVVRATLLSTSGGNLRFRAIEYLKGSGPSEFTVNASTPSRNTVWDGLEAVLFLSQPSSEGASGASTDFEFTDTATWYYDPSFPQYYSGDLPEGYTIGSRNPAWLPAESGAEGAIGTPGDSSSFITDLPNPWDGSQPVISLADLRAKIAWIEGGEGIAGYDKCIKISLASERYYRDREAYYKSPSVRAQYSPRISSGAGANTIVDDWERSRKTNYDAPYLTGPYTDLFRAQIVDDDSLASNGYHRRLATARPLPSGTYMAFFHLQLPDEMPCSFRPDYDGLEYLITVTAPSGTLHEAFFDPVAIGTTIGADGTNGVLKPNTFTASDSTTTTLRSIDYSGSSVRMLFSQTTGLSGKEAQFIMLDGTVGLTVPFSSAMVETVASQGTRYSWKTCSAPWAAGEKVMIRIRNTSDSTGSTPSCVSVTPTPTPDPSATATPGPSPTPMP